MRILDELVRMMPRFPSETILKFHAVIAASARGQIEELTSGDDGLRRLWEVVDLVLATIRGIVRFNLVNEPRGFDAIDHLDCREWLEMNGASKRFGEQRVLASALRFGVCVRRRRRGAAANCRRSSYPGRGASLLHLPWRVLLEDARRDGRRRVCPVLRGLEPARCKVRVLPSASERAAVVAFRG